MSFVPSPEQRAVIEHGLAPLRVAAGAGTGKTTTLAYRMARLVERYGIQPEQALGVTFTNKAVDELARRLDRIGMGDGPDRQVDVFTYHGFAAHLLGRYGVLVGMERGTRIITPAFARRVLADCVVRTPFEAVDASDTARVTAALVELSGELADNLVRPEQLAEIEPANELERRRAELAAALVEFEQVKRRLGVRDYGDLIRLAVELVVEHPSIAARIRRRYRCVLLDEYQDTNPAQRDLFAILFGGGTAVTAVGDLDQTIYEWRGASPANFEGFPGLFRQRDGAEAPTLRLSFNRRSGRRILDLANRIRARISLADPSGGDLAALEGAPTGDVRVAWHGDARREAEEIARETRRLHGAGVAWSDVAILFRRNRDIEPVRLALEEHDIPLQVTDLGGLLQVPEIVELHAWLRILARPEDGPALVRILLGSGFRLGLSDLAELSRWVAARTGRSRDPARRHTLIEAIERLDDLDVPPGARESLGRFRRRHRALVREAQGSDLSELVRVILTRTGAWQEIDAMPAPFDLSARLNVHRFLDFTEHWRPLEGASSLEGFLDHLDLIRSDPAEQLDTARVGGDEAVALMTVHRAKGLEWRAVFVPALYRGNFPASPRSLRDPSRWVSTLPAHLRRDAEFRENLDPSVDAERRRDWLRRRHYDQEWRLAYVAATRAREYLYLSGAHWYGSPRPHKRPSRPSDLIEMARRLEGAVIDRWNPEPPPRPETLRFPAPQPGPDPILGTTWEEALHRIAADPGWADARAEYLGVRDAYDESVEMFEQVLVTLPEPADPEPEPGHTTVSVTGLVTYAECPKRYFWSEVDRLPRRPGPAARRGVELHRRIELHNRGMVPFDDLDEDLYDRSPGEGAGGSAGDGGWEAFADSRYASESPAQVETPFELRLSDQALIRGRVDAIYQSGERGWKIVDFKSGRRSARPSTEVQLEAYAVAAAEGCLGTPPPEALEVSFVYLGGGLDVAGREVDGQWLDRARERLAELIDGIRSESFDPAPSSACRACDFRTFCEEGKRYLSANG